MWKDCEVKTDIIQYYIFWKKMFKLILLKNDSIINN